jgi:hypothetical protein
MEIKKVPKKKNTFVTLMQEYLYELTVNSIDEIKINR